MSNTIGFKFLLGFLETSVIEAINLLSVSMPKVLKTVIQGSGRDRHYPYTGNKSYLPEDIRGKDTVN